MEHVTYYFSHYGYWAIFFVILFEDFGLPVPGELTLVTGSILAATGHFSLPLVLGLAFMGAVIGDNVGYLLGYYGGRRLIINYGRYVFITPQRFHKLEAFFLRYGDKIVTVARFINGLRQCNGIIAGISRMRQTKFLMYNAIGAALWVGVWGGAAYILGRRTKSIAVALAHLELLFLSVAGFLLIGWGIERLIKKHFKM